MPTKLLSRCSRLELPFGCLLLALIFCATLAAQASAPSAPRYKNPAFSVQDRVKDLLARMTLEEKVSEITGGWESQVHVLDPTGAWTDETARKALAKLQDPDFRFTPKQAASLRNGVQRYLREKTRLGIPALFINESLHGYMEDGSTSFPQALALAATWDPSLVKKVFSAAGAEAGARGTDWVLSPVVDLARDPRWGRTEETYGEDPYLVSRMGVAAVTGLQGDDYFIGRSHVLATAKHFAVHGQPEGGANTSPGNYSERLIRESFLVPFEALVKEGHIGSVMASYNEIDGVPSHINHWLLERVLREEWGFDGLVTSDGFGIQMLFGTHHVAYGNADAARRSLAAGVDYDLSDGSAFRTLLDQVKKGVVPVSEIDRAAARMLTAKFRLGLFENPYVDADRAEQIVQSPEHRALALEAARKAIVLLKNEKSLLPLDTAKYKTLAVIGPNAADIHLGGYSRDPHQGVSLLDGIRARVGDKGKVLYAEGCKITNARPGVYGWFDNDVKLYDAASQASAIQNAVAVARKADAVILVVGENESTNREAWSDEHLGDRDSLELAGAQNDLVRAVMETGKPVVVFLLNGRPLSINAIAQHAPAILEGFYLGQEGGAAAAEVLFGDVTPGGKLPISFPRSVGDLPDYYNRKPSTNRNYAFGDRSPLYAFGHGLSYTSFRFDNLRVADKQIKVGGETTFTVDVTNTGARAGDEVAEFYVHPRISNVTQPVKRLVGFERVSLQPGEKRTVSLRVTPEMLSILGLDMQKIVEPGSYELMVGPSSDQVQTARLDVLGRNGETCHPPLPAAPKGSEQPLVASFEDGSMKCAYGSLMNFSDAMFGGKSTVKSSVVEPGANGGQHALKLEGETQAGSYYPIAGVLFSPAAMPMTAANLSDKKGFSFWAKGDGKSYTIIALTDSRNGQNGPMPATRTFVATPEWKLYSFSFEQFETDAADLQGLAIGQTQPGAFSLQIDELRIE